MNTGLPNKFSWKTAACFSTWIVSAPLAIDFMYLGSAYPPVSSVFGDGVQRYITDDNFDLTNLEEGHTKTVQQWILLGGPSLRLGVVSS